MAQAVQHVSFVKAFDACVGHAGAVEKYKGSEIELKETLK